MRPVDHSSAQFFGLRVVERSRLGLAAATRADIRVLMRLCVSTLWFDMCFRTLAPRDNLSHAHYANPQFAQGGVAKSPAGNDK